MRLGDAFLLLATFVMSTYLWIQAGYHWIVPMMIFIVSMILNGFWDKWKRRMDKHKRNAVYGEMIVEKCRLKVGGKDNQRNNSD